MPVFANSSLSVLASSFILFTSSGAMANDNASEAFEGDDSIIIVTAQKRSQSILSVPIALTSYNAEALEKRRVTDVAEAVQRVPGVASVNPSNELTQVSIRGITTADYGIGSDPAVGVFVDDVYLGRSDNAAATFIDLERVEVARGPQGALFGRATPGGAISLITAKPTAENEIRALAEIGLDAERRAYLIGNGGISDNLFVRGNFYYRNRGDYVTNETTGEQLGGEERFAGRASLLFDNGGPTTVQLTGWAETYSGDPWLYRNFELTVPEGVDAANPLSFNETIFSDVSESQLIDERDNWGSILRVEHDLNGYSLISITSALGFNADYLEDFDGSDLFLFNYRQRGDQSLLTQELRVVSPDDEPFQWFAGALIYREKIQTTYVQSYGDFDLCVYYEFGDETDCAPAGNGVTDTFIFASARNDGFALYGEGSFELSPSLRVSGGLRYTNDDKQLTVNAPVPGGFLPAEDVGYIIPTDGLDVRRAKEFDSFQARATLTWQSSQNLSLYGSISNGEKPGGFDTFDPFSPAFNAEKVTSYELGAKGSVLDGTLNFAVAGYLYNYNDLQVLVAEGPRDIVKNAAKADGKGVELEASYSGIDKAILEFRMAITDAEYNNFLDGTDNFSGNQLTYTPNFSIGASAEIGQTLTSDWDWYARVDADYQSRQYFTPENAKFASQPGFENVDLRVGLRQADGGLEVYAFGQNVTGADVAGYGNVTDYDANFGGYIGQFGRPAIFGIGLTLKN